MPVTSHDLAKIIEEQKKSLKEKGLSSDAIDEVTTNTREMYEKSLGEEGASIDAEIKSTKESIEKSVDEKVEAALEARFKAHTEKTEEVSARKKAVYGYKTNKTLADLEGDERTAEFLKYAINSAITKDPSDYAMAKALSEGTDADGGHLVPEEFAMQLIESIQEQAVVRASGATVWPMARKTLELPALGSRPLTSWGSENATIATTTADFSNLTLTAYKLVSRMYMSSELVEDSTPAIVEIIRRLFVNAIVDAEDVAFLNGSGTGRPKGILQYTLGSISAGGALTGDHLIDLATHKLGQGYRKNAVWFMNPRTWANILKLKDSNNAYLFQAPGNVLQAGAQAMLLGRPLYENSTVPSGTILYGDPSYYYIGDRKRLAISTTTEADDTFKKDQLQIKVRERVDGQLSLEESFVKITSTGVS